MAELRKIQQTPTGTFFVCLPRDWAKKKGLKKGALVCLDVTGDGKLIVDAEYNAEPPAKATSLTVGPYLSREIIGRYLLGFDIIDIEAKDRIDSSVRNTVKSTASSLSGLEIFEETISKISLHSLMQQPSALPEKILHRNYAIVAGMLRDAANSFVYGDIELAKNVIARDDESNRLYFLLVRILRTIIQNPRLNEKLGITPIECLDYRLAASLIEGIGDACVQVAEKTIALNGVKFSEEMQKLLIDLQSACYEAHEQALKSFVTKNIALADNVRTTRGKIDAISTDIERVAKGSTVDLMSQILAVVSLLRQIYEHSVDIADLVA
ncbi:MAG TPA: phosphate uptake regulator PhoU [Candidatus Limnocylindrales bacterium]|nr:phosphate uptake regulator PhoU [Candidatus Limnocylindrales bacterium]